MELSPDGKHAVFIGAGEGQGTIAAVIDLVTGSVKPVQLADGKPLRLISCGWSANDRIACNLYGIGIAYGSRVSYTRLVAFNADGGKVISLGRQSSGSALRVSQYQGDVIDWLGGDNGSVLMVRDYVPEFSTGSRLAQTHDGMGVDQVDTRTGNARPVELPTRKVDGYLSDGLGHIRIRWSALSDGDEGRLTGVTAYSYRIGNSGDWKPFSRVTVSEAGLRPIGVDGQANAAYALRKLNGREALYRVALDGSMKTELVFSSPDVDIEDVVTIGRHGRVIGATYVTDRRQVEYFDPEYRKLATSLSRALPKLPLVRFASANADESRLLLFAGSDVDAGRYYLFDRATHQLSEVLPSRPQLETVRLAEVKTITYPAADGTMIPAYLTLPPGSDGRGLPALVMPHGGPSARDEWGFDWLAQFFAQRGYAVLQPNYRGSAGYGDDWSATNAFRSWRLAIGDVTAAGRWLVSSGTAAPGKLGIFGWSYGGYAALQSNVVAPDLFRAVVAVAPVTDLRMLKDQSREFTDSRIVADFIGGPAIAAEASPARHADQFRAPVLMFHGDNDLNVGIGQSRAMDAALKKAGHDSVLVVFPGLDHQLEDGKARTDMLTRSDAFFRTAMKM